MGRMRKFQWFLLSPIVKSLLQVRESLGDYLWSQVFLSTIYISALVKEPKIKL